MPHPLYFQHMHVCTQSTTLAHETPGIHFALRRNSTPPSRVHFPRKSSTNKRFPWPGREVSPEIDVSRHCQLCAIATSFFQASGETWNSKTAIPKGWDHFRPIPQRVTNCPGVPGKMLSVSRRRPRETPRSFASPKQLVIYLAIIAKMWQLLVKFKWYRKQEGVESPRCPVLSQLLSLGREGDDPSLTVQGVLG